MTVQVEAREIAVKDYVNGYGTVTAIKETKNAQGEVTFLDITFFNGQLLTAVDPDAVFDVIGGGLTDHGPIGSIRPGLAADHADGN